MSATRAPKAFDTPRLTPPPSDGRAMEFRQFLNKRLPFVKQETLPKEFFTKLVPFPSEKAQELLDKLKDNTLYDGECWPSLCVTKAQEEQKTQEEQKGRKGGKKPKASKVQKVENEQKEQEPQEASQGTDAPRTSSSQQPACASSSLGTRKKESELYQPFVRIAQTIAEMSVDSSQNQHHIAGVWIDTHKKEPETTNIDSNISLIPDICFVQGDTPEAENVADLRDWGCVTQNTESGETSVSAVLCWMSGCSSV